MGRSRPGGPGLDDPRIGRWFARQDPEEIPVGQSPLEVHTGPSRPRRLRREEAKIQIRQTCVPVIALGAGYVAAGAASHLGPAGPRALVCLCLITMLSMTVSAFSGTRPRELIPILVAATVLSLGVIHGWRRWFDPAAAVGPVPPSLEPVALAALGAVNVAAGIIVVVAFAPGRRMFRWRWVVFGATGVVLLAVCGLASRWADAANSPQMLLRRAIMLEQSSDRNDWVRHLKEAMSSVACLACGGSSRTTSQARAGGSPRPPRPPSPPASASPPWRRSSPPR